MEPSLNLRSWTHFLAIAEAGSFTRAALQLRVAQPVLSREVAELERQLGGRLFHRHARGVKLSPIGDQFRARAKDILDQIERVPQGLLDATEEPIGTLSVGMPPSMAGSITCDAVRRYGERHRASRLNLSLLPGEECYEQLVERRLDLAVIAHRKGQRGIDVSPVLTEEIGVYGAHALLGGVPDTIGIAQLAALPLILAPPPSLIHDMLSGELTRAGLRLNIAMEGNIWATYELVRQGVGLAIFSECARGSFDQSLIRFVRIAVPPSIWSVATLSYRPVTPAANAFSRILREVIAIYRERHETVTRADGPRTSQL